MPSRTKGRSLISEAIFDQPRLASVVWLAWVFAVAAGRIAQAGGTCITNADCNQSPNFCRPGVCDLFGQCQYQHDDGLCRVPPYGDNLFCNGIDYCNESLNGGAGGCAINPVNCVPPTPYCNETIDACVECLSNSNCTTPPRLTCKASTGVCVQCLSDADCSDGLFCTGQETCNLTTGLCQAGTPVSCSPGKFCSEIYLGACVGCEQDSNCNDGLYCNGVETCNPTTHLCVAGTPPVCKRCVSGAAAGAACLTSAECRICVGGQRAGNPCTADGECPGGTCPAGGTCTGPTTYCDENYDGCSLCVLDAHCNDGKFCTRDECVFRQCVNAPDPALCDDHVFCNGAETCNGTTGQCGPGTPPNCTKTCFRGLTPGATCVSDAACSKACDAGFNAGQVCVTDANCSGACEGGANAGVQCTSGLVCASGVCRTGLCIPGLCRGGCSEQFDACVQCASDVTGSTSCDDGLSCDGTEACNGLHECAAGTNMNCSAMDDLPCGVGKCNETTDLCQLVATPGVPNGTACDDGNICTRVDYCQSGLCVEHPPAANDPYRCVNMELRPATGQYVIVNSTVSVDLYLAANGCNTASDDCLSTEHPVQGVSAILSWDPAVLQLQPSTPSDKNPLDPCDDGNSCYVCNGICSGGSHNGLTCNNTTLICPGTCVGGPENGLACNDFSDFCARGYCIGGSNPGGLCITSQQCPGGACPTGNAYCNARCNPNPPTYNWSSSFFPNDCGGDGLNQPCPYTGFPGNDGNAMYNAIPQLMCGSDNARLPCATSSGLDVTKFKFKALSRPQSGSTQISLLPCDGQYSTSEVISGIQPPSGYSSSDVTKAIGAAAVIAVYECETGANCVDANLCTVDRCVAGVCRHDLNNCDDSDLCTTDVCVSSTGICTHTPMNCGAGNRCFEGACYKTCVTAQDCNDNFACTTDTCFAVTGDDICKHAPNDALCSTGLFCSAKICDPQLGCVFDHQCVSTTGNPCKNPASCNETTDNCGGCLMPAAVAGGSRYINVTPPVGQGATPVAILIEGDCLDGTIGCVSKYVQPKCAGGANDGQLCQSDANCPKTCGGSVGGTVCTSDAGCTGGAVCIGSCDKGFVGASPTYMSASAWGTINVHASELRPSSKYHVYSVCNISGSPMTSAANRVTTYRWGDTNGDGIVDFSDISGVVNAFKKVYSSTQTYQSTNVSCGDPQAGCIGQECINFNDVSLTVDAFKGNPFPSGCSTTCP